MKEAVTASSIPCRELRDLLTTTMLKRAAVAMQAACKRDIPGWKGLFFAVLPRPWGEMRGLRSLVGWDDMAAGRGPRAGLTLEPGASARLS